MWPTFTMISCHIRLIGGKKNLKVLKNMERFTNLRVILAQGPC